MEALKALASTTSSQQQQFFTITAASLSIERLYLLLYRISLFHKQRWKPKLINCLLNKLEIKERKEKSYQKQNNTLKETSKSSILQAARKSLVFAIIEASVDAVETYEVAMNKFFDELPNKLKTIVRLLDTGTGNSSIRYIISLYNLTSGDKFG